MQWGAPPGVDVVKLELEHLKQVQGSCLVALSRDMQHVEPVRVSGLEVGSVLKERVNGVQVP